MKEIVSEENKIEYSNKTSVTFETVHPQVFLDKENSLIKYILKINRIDFVYAFSSA